MPNPIHAAPRVVAPIAVVAACRASAISFSANASASVETNPPTIQSSPATSAPTSARMTPT
jgi:hypothetical protein